MMAADYRHIGGVENRLGRHYSRFSPFSPTPALADQSLAWRKLWNAGSNRRSRAKAMDALPLPPAARVLGGCGVVWLGPVRPPPPLAPGDYVLALARPQDLVLLDRLFGPRPERSRAD